uniref:Uncharacterized protein AlNc14C262G9831 n=1 Tax=Albugo laibachii Nc14 TaxID=890382 RepID=F0WU08_9STRA|nr:conserved hypothetical protein [Albugo laibachii Nc14]|eukprot:CCA24852.1 conserved hypothetical protein [Albugo laibachii Nc14]
MVSARQAKRLEKYIDGERQGNDPYDGGDRILNDEPEPKKTAIGFQCLQDSDSDSEAESDNSDEEGKSADPMESPPPATQPSIPLANKRLHYKKKKAKNTSKRRNLIPDPPIHDQVLQVINSHRNDPESVPNASTKWNELLRVRLRLTNAEREMNRIFKIKAEKETAKRPKGGRFRDPNKVAWRSLRKTLMVTPDASWSRPPSFIGGGIRWARCGRPEGECWDECCEYFQVVWSSEYEKSSKMFQTVQSFHDPQALAEFLQRNPYQLEALLQMSRVYQHHGQMDQATDCIKRCIYALELSWSEHFDVSNGRSRMDYHMETNTTFYKALFLYMQQAGRRGCVKSAFELARMIFSLDPHGDPMSVVLAMDYYALASRQYTFILELMDANIPAIDRLSSCESSSLSTLPNLQLSSALAMFHSEKEEASEQLAKALLMYPSVLGLLLENCNGKSSSETWRSILEDSRFADARPLEEASALAHVLSIYVLRHAQLWKSEDVLRFLLQGAKLATESSVLRSAYPQVMELPPSLSKYHQAATQDYTDEVTTLPVDDPMPIEVHPLMEQMDANPRIQLVQEEDDVLRLTGNPLLLFLQSLLPWNRMESRGN